MKIRIPKMSHDEMVAMREPMELVKTETPDLA